MERETVNGKGENRRLKCTTVGRQGRYSRLRDLPPLVENVEDRGERGSVHTRRRGDEVKHLIGWTMKEEENRNPGCPLNERCPY